MNSRYLEIDSTYRDRNKFPLPSNFEIPMAQSARKTLNNAEDPVSLGIPIRAWTCNNLSTSVPNIFRILCVVEPKTTRLSGLTDTITFIINSSQRLQQMQDYYKGCIMEDAAFFNRRRIKKYTFLGSFPAYDRAEIQVEVPFPETFVPTNQVYIYDPTDISNPTYPVFFVPDGSVNENAYCSYFLFNETRNEYRPISFYNNSTRCIYLDLSNDSQGDIVGWSLLDNYCIRKDLPFLPAVGNVNAQVISNSGSSIIIDTSYTEDLNFKFVRITPSTYNYNYTGEINRRIISYNNITNELTVFPVIDEIITPGSNIEILNFSYDNLFPFVYTGSQLSHQELVCYEMELLSLILPSETLKCMDGGSISHYQYVYVEITNLSTGSLKNIIYSNNPHASKAIFKVPCFDIQDAPVYVKIGGGQIQTIKFKPNDTLSFSVKMPNGEYFQTLISDKFSPEKPDPRIQINALFGLRRIG
jgi:hypothetical protein